MYILIAILVFGFLIFVHELGHYLVARACHITVKAFAIGMGPKLVWYTSKKTGTTYSLNMLPIGGYVSMAGEDEESEDPHAFSKKPVWQRLAVTVAGAVMNIAVGMLLMCCLVLYVVNSDTYRLGTTVVAEFVPASETGYTVSTEGTLQVNDRILSLNGRRVHIAEEVSYAIMYNGISPMKVEVLRDGEVVPLLVQFPTYEDGFEKFGAADFRVYAERSSSFPTIVRHSFYKCTLTVRMVWDSLKGLVSGRFSFRSVSGPVGVTSAISTAASNGLYTFLYLTAVIAVNLGLMNLLPLPALDGGRIFLLLIEGVTRKRLPTNVEAAINGAGILLLLGLMAVITFRDVLNLL